jgi:molybdenum cofactor biosynthesis enzyme MoaA
MTAEPMERVTFEVTTRCNLKCVMCPHGLPDGYPGQSDVADSLVEEVIAFLDEMQLISPTGVGEPLLAPGFWRIVDSLKGRRNPKLMFVTNGILLTKANVDRLAGVPMHQVNISLDAARPETHLRIRGNDMEKSLTGIRNLVAMRTRTGADFIVRPSFVIMRENVEEAPEFIELAHSLGADAVYFEHLVQLMTDPKEWKVRRGNWTFTYADHDMRSDPDVSDYWLTQAMDRADALGIQIEGHGVLLHEGLEREALMRPCRRSAGLRVAETYQVLAEADAAAIAQTEAA